MTYDDISDFFVKLMKMPFEDFVDCYGEEASVVDLINSGKKGFDDARKKYQDYYSREIELGDEVENMWLKGIYIGKVGESLHTVICKDEDGSVFICKANQLKPTGRKIPSTKAFMDDLAKWEF
jgi:hypothetical protein